MKKLLFLIIMILSVTFVHCGPSHDKPAPPAVVNKQPSQGIQGGIFYWTHVTIDGDWPDDYYVRCVSKSGTIPEINQKVYWEVNNTEVDVDMYKVLPIEVNETWNCFAKAYSTDRDGDWSLEPVQFTVENRIIK